MVSTLSFIYILSVDSALTSTVSVYEFNGSALSLLGDVAFAEELERINVITRNNRTLLVVPENTGSDSNSDGTVDLFKVYTIYITDTKLFTTSEISSFTVT